MGMDRHTMSLADYASEYQWIRMLGWSEDDLRRVPVTEQLPAGDEAINLADFGGTPEGVVRSPASPTSADARAVPCGSRRMPSTASGTAPSPGAAPVIV